MITFFFLILFGTVIVGFGLYHFVFSDKGRRGKAPEVPPASKKQEGRAAGLD